MLMEHEHSMISWFFSVSLFFFFLASQLQSYTWLSNILTKVWQFESLVLITIMSYLHSLIIFTVTENGVSVQISLVIWIIYKCYLTASYYDMVIPLTSTSFIYVVVVICEIFEPGFVIVVAETKERIVANLANFAYDPYNYAFLRQVQCFYVVGIIWFGMSPKMFLFLLHMFPI